MKPNSLRPALLKSKRWEWHVPSEKTAETVRGLVLSAPHLVKSTPGRAVYHCGLKETSPEHSLEEMMLKLKLQYFGHLMRKTDSLEKTLMLGRIKGRRRRGQQRMRWLDDITDSMDMNLSKLGDGQGSLVCCSPWGRKEPDTTELLN